MIRKNSAAETENTVVPKFALVLVIFLTVSLISVLLLQRLAEPASTVDSGTFDLVEATQEFIGGEDMNITARNLRVHIPRNSISWTGTIAITTRDPSLFHVEGETEWARPQVYSVEFLNAESTPVPGIIFSNPIQICFKVTNEQWKDFTERPDAYQVQYFAVENNPPAWTTLPLKAYAGELCGLVNHLSLFALAMRIDSSIPVTGPTLTPSPTPTRTRPEPAATRDNSGGFVPTSTRTPISTATTVPSLVPSETPKPSDTPPPTDTAEPPPTDTVEPPPTDTSEPPPTDTAEPPPTDTSVPPPSNTEEPPPTDTPEPVSTDPP